MKRQIVNALKLGLASTCVCLPLILSTQTGLTKTKPVGQSNKTNDTELRKEIRDILRESISGDKYIESKLADKLSLRFQDKGIGGSGLTLGSLIYSTLLSLATGGFGFWIATILDKKHEGRRKRLKEDIERTIAHQNTTINSLQKTLYNYQQNTQSLRIEWTDDIRRAISSALASREIASRDTSEATKTIALGDRLGSTTSQFEQVPTPPPLSLHSQVKAEFGKNSSFFYSERFYPMRDPDAWQGVVNREGGSDLKLEDCQLADASYLRFTDIDQDYLIPNTTDPRLRRQILQMEEENNSAFQIRVSSTGELKLHQAAKIVRNGANGWIVLEQGIIER